LGVSDAPDPKIPSVLRRLSTDEYDAPPYDVKQRQAVTDVVDSGPDSARRLARPLADYWSSRLGTAVGLRALNESFGVECYQVPVEATMEQAAADEALGGTQTVVDVQTHFMADREALHRLAGPNIDFYQALSPDWWSGLDGITFHGFAEYLRCVFLESETALAVLSAPPPDSNGDWFLTNEELAGTRELIDRLAGSGRLLNHTVIHPTMPGNIERMEEWRDTFHPVGWKVYTMGRFDTERTLQGLMGFSEGSGWMLDDERIGVPLLEEARRLGVMNICSHKGLSGLVDNGSPRDIGPCAKAFPDLRFIVYHSGFEGVAEDEGPFTPETADLGINRLITTAVDNGIGPGGNIYAELGTTWFCLVKRPIEAAHVLGKLLVAFGEDNILWGTDAIWYGSSQPAIDAFRTFQIPPALREQYGYPELTPEIKTKILGLNAARVYNLDLAALSESSRSDDLAWAKQAIADYKAGGAG
jgi:uncharacterized protein